jgi:hypothetical protein
MSEDIILESNNKSNNKQSIWDELKEFWDELINLLYTDLQNSYLFLTQNKNYFIYAILLAILLQFTNVSTLGISINKYCNKVIKNQIGGNGEVPSSVEPTDLSKSQYQSQATQYADYKKNKKEQKKTEQEIKKDQKKTEKQIKKEETFSKDVLAKAKKKGLDDAQSQQYLEKKTLQKQQKQDKIDLSIARKSSIAKYDADMKAKKQQDNESKINQKRISFFENIKNKFGKGSNWGGQYGVIGPVFGNMEKIFDSVKTIFYIITIILTIAGILSIPVLIFLIITYMVFKAMVGKFTAL